jgi:prepilin-type N-terminal cleavage/methylation domain-containing protein/prepilin-type processing-associated H-X9-DG protein
MHRPRHPSARNSNRPGFSLVEVLVVVGILAALTAVLLPAIQAARGAGRRMQCSNRLRQIALAAIEYHGSQRSYPPGLQQSQFSTAPQYRGTSLFVYLLPYLDRAAAVEDWDANDPMNNTRGGLNARTAAVLPELICPDDHIARNPMEKAGRYYGMTSYGGNGGTRSYDPDYATLDGMFHTTGPASLPHAGQEAVRQETVYDGSSHTLFFGERSHDDRNFETFAASGWTDSLDSVGTWSAVGGRKRIADVTMSAHAPINYRLPFSYAARASADPAAGNAAAFACYEDLRLCAWGSSHAGGANFAMVDGSLRFLRDGLAMEVLRALSTRNGGEKVDDE